MGSTVIPRPTSPRLRDVAEAAGVHLSTASRALNDQTAAMVQPKTAERVRLAATELGYRVNGMARGLKTRRSMSIGMVVPDITNPFFPPAVRGAEEALSEAGFSLLLSSTDNNVDKARAQLDAMIEARVDGLMLAIAHRHDAIVDRLHASGTPAVLFNRTVDRGAISSVVPDDARGSRLAVAHLQELGHRQIGLVAGPLFTSNGDRRLRAFRRAVSRLGLQCHVVEATAFDEDAGYHAMQQLIEEYPEMTAVVASNDLIALGVIDAATDAGLECPRDLSVVGFNDMPLASRLQPPLTTVTVPERALGRLAAECLLRAIADPGAEPERIVVPVTLVVRGSSGPLR
ncbi:MAG TPA: LacI family DNA-binding transcriptional regulator [Jatrophihabitans sp.]